MQSHSSRLKSGGKTLISGMIHAVVLALIVLKAGALTALIPRFCRFSHCRGRGDRTLSAA
ncbi:MAG: hypothetical protein HC805_00095 [Alkalinema sp. RL_2_19]|nr:hypothetical protein [Alkalinema sp. RL_2_19]